MNLENKILESFKKYMKKEVEGLELLVSIPDCWDEDYSCTVMEKRENGKVWDVECTKNGNVKNVYEL